MDISTVIGLIFGAIAVIGSIMYSGSIVAFWDIPSIFVVCGGTFAATLIKWPLEDVKSLIGVTLKAFFVYDMPPIEAIEQIQNLAQIARRESVFALEKVEITEPFMKKAITLAADNRPPEVIRSILTLEMEAMEDRHSKGIDMLDGMGSDAPAFGMIGTLIGLVLMLRSLSDPTAIGPAMAVALITTFYGSILANLVFLPLANKLKTRSKQEMINMNIVLAGTLGIVAGENPRVIREKLDSFLSPQDRLAAVENSAKKES